MSMRHKGLLGLFATLPIAAACSGGAPPAATPAGPNTPAATAEAKPAFPATVADLGTVVPFEANWVVELPDPAKVAGLLPAEQRALLGIAMPFVESALAEKVGIDIKLVGDLFDSFERATAFGDMKTA